MTFFLTMYTAAGVFLCAAAAALAIRTELWDRWLAGFFALASVGLLVLVGTATGLYFNYDAYFGDLWTATDALNRVDRGLRASTDFFSPIGPVYYWGLAAGIALGGDPTPASILHASAVAGALAAVFSVALLWRRMSLLGIAVVVFSVVAVAVSGRGNGELLFQLPMHYVAPYNRWAWALFVPVALRLCLPADRRDILGSLVLGVALALLMMTKVTYGAAAFGLLLVHAVLVRGGWRELPGALVMLGLCLGALEVATGQFTAHLADLATTSALPESGLRFVKLFTQLGEMGLFVVLAVATYFLARWSGPDSEGIAVFLRPVVLIMMAAGAGCAVLMQNHYAVEAAVYPLLPLLALEWARRDSPAPPSMAYDWDAFRLRLGTMVVVAIALFYPIIDTGMQMGQRLQLSLNEPDPEFAGTPYANLLFEPSLSRNPYNRIRIIPDGRSGVLAGLAVLRDLGAAEPETGAVVTLAFSNPFPLLLEKPSPAGPPIWLHEGRSFSRDVFVPPDIFFADVDYVMVPADGHTLAEIYEQTLTEMFEIAHEDGFWTVYTRRSS